MTRALEIADRQGRVTFLLLLFFQKLFLYSRKEKTLTTSRSLLFRTWCAILSFICFKLLICMHYLLNVWTKWNEMWNLQLQKERIRYNRKVVWLECCECMMQNSSKCTFDTCSASIKDIERCCVRNRLTKERFNSFERVITATCR